MPLAVPASGEHRSGQPAPRGRGGGGGHVPHRSSAVADVTGRVRDSQCSGTCCLRDHPGLRIFRREMAPP